MSMLYKNRTRFYDGSLYCFQRTIDTAQFETSVTSELFCTLQQ